MRQALLAVGYSMKRTRTKYTTTIMKMFNPFSWLAGDPQGVLRSCSEKARIDSSILGATLILPTVIWGAGAYATAHMMGAAMIPAFIAAAVIGILVLILDRGMMAYLAKSNRSWVGIVSRAMLAVLGSIAFAHPAVFFLARGLIDRELASQSESAIEMRKAEIVPQLKLARERIDRNAGVARDALQLANKAYQDRDAGLREAHAEVVRWRNEADLEGRGVRGTAGKVGEGPNYDRAITFGDEAKARVLVLQDDLAKLGRSKEEAARALVRILEEGKSDPEVVRLESDLSLALGKIRGHEVGDPFSQYEALHQVIARNWKDGSYALGVGYMVACLLLLGLELTPLALKMGAGGGELAIATGQLQFKAEQDAECYCTVYPGVAAEMTRSRLQLEMEREKMELENQLAMDRVRKPAALTREILAEQDQVFQLVAEILKNVRKASEERKAAAERLADRLLDAFDRSVEAEMKAPRGSARRSAA